MEDLGGSPHSRHRGSSPGGAGSAPGIWRHKRDSSPCKVLVTNRITWEANRILGVYRKRWTGTETFHRDGKQELGLGDCQLHDGQGQTRHMYLEMMAYCLLMRQIRQGCAHDWAFQKLMTIGEACRAMLRETLSNTLTWVIRQATDFSWSSHPKNGIDLILQKSSSTPGRGNTGGKR